MNGTALRRLLRFLAILGAVVLLGGQGGQTQAPATRFDHLATGFGLTGAHIDVKCETCHARGVFKGTLKACEGCHGAGGRLSSVLIPASHAPTIQPCQVCHNTRAFSGAHWNHADVAPGTCASCHNGTTAPGKSSNHLPTTMSCDGCHRTTAWRPAGFDHAGVTAACASCHNGTMALGKIARHIPTTSTCETCHSSTATFSTWKMNHVGIAEGCAACHGGQFRDVMAKSTSHIPTTASCETCHSSQQTFKVATFAHPSITSGCATCHDGSRATGKATSHFPTTASCEACHTSTSSFSTWKMNHAGVSGACATCHGGQFAAIAAKPSNHFPTTAPCEQCHSSFNAFKGATFSHSGIASGCAGCHNGEQAIGKPANRHIPTNVSCESCHTSTAAFSTWTMSHAGIASGCMSCHNGQFSDVKSKPTTHVPTGAACETCHAASRFTSFAGVAMNHAGITTGCASCHATGSSFFGVTMKTPPANHIPFGGAACESCHSTSNYTSFATTPMNHAPVSAIACSTCHERGRSWFGVTIVTRPSDPSHPPTGECNGCHSSTTSFSTGVAAKPANHIPTTQPCTLCHTTPGNYLVYTMSHTGITSGCATCHAAGLSFDRGIPKPPPANHIPTTRACETCHTASNFSSWGATVMNHTGITTSCATCHASGSSFFGVTMKTPPANHIPFGGAACESCHSTSNYTSFATTPMNHAPVAAIACSTCHESGRSWFGVTIVTRPSDPSHPPTGECNGCHSSTTSFSTVTAKPASHIPTTQPCTLCHTTPGNYLVYTMSHTGITSGCATCHAAGLSFDRGIPKPPPANHIPTTRACETCHTASNFSSWGATAMNHAGITTGCASCHAAGSSFFGVTMKTPPANHIPFGGAGCESCHSTSNYTSFAATPMNHAPVSAIACSTCHESGRSWFGVTIVTRPTPAKDPSHPTTGECNGCHSSTTSFSTGVAAKPANHIPTTQPCTLCHTTPGNYLVYTMSHTGITSGCAACHAAGLSFDRGIPKPPPANHIPTTRACETCHTASNFSSWGATVMNHTGITTSCATCHAAGSSFFGVTMKTPPANHVPTTRPCETCHSASNYTSFAGTAMNHTGITTSCATCHAAGSSFFGVTMKTPPANHIPFGGAACESCHSTSNYASFATTPMNHAPVAAIACSTCHERGRSWFGVTIVTRPSDPSHPPTGECNGCHSSTTSFSTGVAAKPANHIPTTQPCTLCHTTPGNYLVYTMSHTGITSGCAACHAAGLSFDRGIPKPPPANHIPTTRACETCHTASNFSSWGATAMNHAGITTGCASCHATGSSFFGVTMKTPPTNHVPTTRPCETCHSASNYTSFAGTVMNHVGIASGCATCHGIGMSWFGVTIVVPPTGATPHIPISGAACEACHSSSTFTTFRVSARSAMNHGAVAGMPCMTCHEFGLRNHWYGTTIVTRPSANHHASQDCGASGCHDTRSFDKRKPIARPAAGAATTSRSTSAIPGAAAVGSATDTVPVAKPLAQRHAGVAPGTCASCHNGTTARARPARHVATTLSCDSCHRTTAWIPATFAHTGVAPGTCVTCHNGAAGSTKAASHFVTVRSCDTCHTTTTWNARVPYRHISPAYSPHSPAVRCVACHVGNGEVVLYRFPANKPDCGACHVDKARPGMHPKPNIRARIP